VKIVGGWGIKGSLYNATKLHFVTYLKVLGFLISHTKKNLEQLREFFLQYIVFTPSKQGKVVPVLNQLSTTP
jgi:hypothetical protein